MTEKNELIKAMVNNPRFEETYNEDTIMALKAFKRGFRFATPEGSTFQEHMTRRLEGMQGLVEALRVAQGLDLPVHVKASKLREGASSLCSYYLPMNRTIHMVGKLSIITLLHEFAHALLGASEKDAQDWSINLYARVYPWAFERLASTGDGMLLEPDSMRTAPATPHVIAVDGHGSHVDLRPTAPNTDNEAFEGTNIAERRNAKSRGIVGAGSVIIR